MYAVRNIKDELSYLNQKHEEEVRFPYCKGQLQGRKVNNEKTQKKLNKEKSVGTSFASFVREH